MGQIENQRIRLTKTLLTDAFLKMLQKQSIHSISIRDLCGKAGINRTTFYHHYGSQYDLLNDIAERFLAQIEDHLAEAEADDRDRVQERVTLVLSFMLDNLSLSRLLLNNNVDPGFAEKLFSLPKISTLFDASLKNCKDEKMKQATIAFAIHGSYHLLQEWINQALPDSPEMQASTILELARRVCAGQQR